MRDLELLEEWMAATSPLPELMARSMPGKVDPGIVAGLAAAREQLEALLQHLDGPSQFVAPEDVAWRRADVIEWQGRAADSLQDPAAARAFYEQAAEAWGALGAGAEAARCRDKLRELRVTHEGEVDDEVAALRRRLEERAAPSTARATTLIALGELLSKVGDDVEARGHLEEAEGVLDEVVGAPSGAAMAAALMASVAAVQDGSFTGGESAIERSLGVHQLRARLYLALGNVHRTTDPQRARVYEDKLRAMRAAADDSFTEALRSLIGRAK